MQLYLLLGLWINVNIVLSTTFTKYNEVPFHQNFSYGIYREQPTGQSSMSVCAAICNTEPGSKCNFYFPNQNVCYLGNLTLDATNVTIAQELQPLYVYINESR